MPSNPLKWHGGKTYLADRIIRLMPPHTHYVEPFFGGGAVLFRKPCEGISEVVNDLNGGLTNFWRVLQDDASFARLAELCEKTPFSSVEFSKASWTESPIAAPSVHNALAFFIRYRQSRQGLGKDFATLTRNRTRRGMNEQVSSWLSAIEGLPEAHARLKRVVVLNDYACKVIQQQDGPNTLYYIDPPYLHVTRVTTGDYEHEMSEAEHAALLGVLSTIKGKFLLSGYPSDLYNSIAEKFGWHKVVFQIDNKASGKKQKDIKEECVWMNYQLEDDCG